MMTVGIAILCAAVGIYLYVMGLCYLCDLYEERKQRRKEEEEQRRKEQLLQAIEETEKRKKAQVERRKRLAKSPPRTSQGRIHQPYQKYSGIRPPRAAQI